MAGCLLPLPACDGSSGGSASSLTGAGAAKRDRKTDGMVQAEGAALQVVLQTGRSCQDCLAPSITGSDVVYCLDHSETLIRGGFAAGIDILRRNDDRFVFMVAFPVDTDP